MTPHLSGSFPTLLPSSSGELGIGTTDQPVSGNPCPLPHCAGPPVNMCPPTYPLECEQCVTECNVENCGLRAEDEEKCTDHCIVVPCDDPCLDSCVSCTMSPHAFCTIAQCQGFEDIVSLLPYSPCSQSAGHSQFEAHTGLPYLESTHLAPSSHTPMPRGHASQPFPDWNNAALSRELDALACACRIQPTPHSSGCNACDPSLLSVEKRLYGQQVQPPVPSAPASSPGSSVSILLSPMPSSCGSSCSTPDPPPVTTSPRVMASELTLQSDLADRRPPLEKLMCLWASCGKPFHSPQALIAHVNTVHLQLPLPQVGLPAQDLLRYQEPSTEDVSLQTTNSVSCLWDNCNRYPTLSQVPGPSTGSAIDAAKGFLACHVQQDHLGIPASRQLKRGAPTHGEHTVPDVSARLSGSPDLSTRPLHPPSPSAFPGNGPCADIPDTAPAPSRHLCKWQSCTLSGVSFETAADLTAHITEVHVGVGNSRYHCLWEGCNRNGDSGFSSKQKILRHVQSHTGYRPFKCKTCDQCFSEAATLQQHMRRHTKEKPYTCDFPGCNKAFAITGALTIHRRVHSGSKPFKCMYCDRSFSESSNLSKHIRTHTGDRPYVCTYPGCEKRFARPDQVARHKNVHNKKLKVGSIDIIKPATVSEGAMDTVP